MEATAQKLTPQYPSREFFTNLLEREVANSAEFGKTLEETLAHLKEIWATPNRGAVLTRLENYIPRRHPRQFPDDMQHHVAKALKYLMRVADNQDPGQRHSADLAVSRLIKFLDPKLQLKVVSPWMVSNRKFRMQTVLRTLAVTDNLSHHADHLVRYHRILPSTQTLRLIARTPEAARQMFPEEIDPYMDAYLADFKSGGAFPDKVAKYHAMLAAKVLIIGEQSIAPDLLRLIPELFSWAIDHIGDPQYEPLLVFLIVENHKSPELLWSAIRTANRQSMPKALERGLEAAKILLKEESGRTQEWV